MLLVWIYNNTGKSVFAVTLCHASSNVSIFLPNYGSYLKTGFNKRSNSAADLRAFDPLSPPEARFRQNVRQSGACKRVPKNG